MDLNAQYQSYPKKKVILQDQTKKTLVPNYLLRTRNNLLVANVLFKISTTPKVAENVGLTPSFKAFDWVINASYYAMYMSAQAALATIGIKCENHSATIVALEYHFVQKQHLEPKYITLIRKHQDLISQNDILSLQDAKTIRERAQYDVSRAIEQTKASELLSEASEFLDRFEKLIGVISNEDKAISK